MHKQLLILKKYPYAAGYILGAFDSSPKNMDVLLENPEVLDLIKNLNRMIRRAHPSWKRDEVYCHGLDIKEALDDEFRDYYSSKGDEKIRTRKLKKVVDKTGHHVNLIRLTSHIGQLIFQEEENVDDGEPDF